MRTMALSYVHLQAPDLDDWRRLAVEGLAFEEAEGPDPDALYLRIDDRPWRFVVERSEQPGLGAVGWELPSGRALDDLVRSLADAGVATVDGDAATCASRKVERLVSCTDPAGVQLEFVVSPQHDHRPVRNIDGTRFVTGSLGAGHVVVGAPDIDASVGFYRDVLGFHLRGSMAVHHSAVPGRTAEDGPAWIRFLGCNPRHHSLAIFQAPIPGMIVHLMVEAERLDDVGTALDRVQRQGRRISATLGRHTNDHMVSFYVQTPSGFDIEYGTGGIHVTDPDSWTETEITAVSFWGHKFGGVYDH